MATKAKDENITENNSKFNMKEYLNEKVEFQAFKDNGKYKDDIVVGHNGKMYRIKRGIKVMIPRKIFNILMRSMNQDAKTADLISEQENAYKNEAKIWNI